MTDGRRRIFPRHFAPGYSPSTTHSSVPATAWPPNLGSRPVWWLHRRPGRAADRTAEHNDWLKSACAPYLADGKTTVTNLTRFVAAAHAKVVLIASRVGPASSDRTSSSGDSGLACAKCRACGVAVAKARGRHVYQAPPAGGSTFGNFLASKPQGGACCKPSGCDWVQTQGRSYRSCSD